MCAYIIAYWSTISMKIFVFILVWLFRVLDGSVIRLSAGEEPTRGRLEVYYNGSWGTVCGDSFSDVTASVACYTLGFGYGGYLMGSYYGPGVDEIWLDDVQCAGNETSLFNCSYGDFGVHNCNHTQDISIRCNASTSAPLNIRLVDGGQPTRGRLEVYYNGSWGTVCSDTFNDAAARIVCLILGFRHGGYVVDDYYGEGVGQIWLDDVYCTGNETSLFNCSHSDYGVHDCNHTQDVSVWCNSSVSVTSTIPSTSSSSSNTAMNPNRPRSEIKSSSTVDSSLIGAFFVVSIFGLIDVLVWCAFIISFAPLYRRCCRRCTCRRCQNLSRPTCFVNCGKTCISGGFRRLAERWWRSNRQPTATVHFTAATPNNPDQCSISIEYRNMVPVPQHWISHASLASAAVNNASNVSIRTKLPSDHQLFLAVSRLVQESWSCNAVSPGCVAASSVIPEIQIREVFLIENPTVYMSYLSKRNEMHLKLARRAIRPINGLRGETEIHSRTLGVAELDQLLDYRVNEYYLTYGTRPENVKRIVNQGLDFRSQLSTSDVFGEGIYLEESTEKSHECTTSTRTRYMFVVRTLLGSVYVCTEAHNFKKPPCNARGCYTEDCAIHTADSFDSVMGINQSPTHQRLQVRQFVVYDKNQCYPEFLVKYTGSCSTV